MTFIELDRLVLSLSNKYYCKYWKLWNYPDNTQFAIQCVDNYGQGLQMTILEYRQDFIKIEDDYIYIFRKNEE